MQWVTRVARRRSGAILVAVLIAESSLGAAPAPTPEPRVIPAPRANFLERCGGCHGLQGVSEAGVVPTILEQSGWFLCLPEGRRYLIQLPNVARVALDDDEVAAMMNYVAFDLGGASRSRYSPYTPMEVGNLRRTPLVTVSLTRLRAELVGRMKKECGAPSSLQDYVGPAPANSVDGVALRGTTVSPRTADISLASQRRN